MHSYLKTMFSRKNVTGGQYCPYCDNDSWVLLEASNHAAPCPMCERGHAQEMSYKYWIGLSDEVAMLTKFGKGITMGSGTCRGCSDAYEKLTVVPDATRCVDCRERKTGGVLPAGLSGMAGDVRLQRVLERVERKVAQR